MYSKRFIITLKPNSYLASITSHALVIPPTPTFCNIDVKQTMAYSCSQKVVFHYGNTSVSLLLNPEEYSEPSQTSKIELFAKIANGF